MAYSEVTKAEALRLRLEEKLGLKEIVKRTGVAKGTLSVWLRSFPLEKSLIRERRSESGRQVTSKRREAHTFPGIERKRRLEAGLLKTDLSKLNPSQKGSIAELAIRLKLCLRGIEFYTPGHEGQKVDLVVRQGSRFLACQIKILSQPSLGLPFLRLRRKHGKETYEPGLIDIWLGYDHLEDVVYVFTKEEVGSHVNTISATEQAKEAWWKLG